MDYLKEKNAEFLGGLPHVKSTNEPLLIKANCLMALRALEDNSVDSLVTDPPAGISFMGKAWDDDKGGRDQWIAWLAEVMQECHRVLKPGAHGLVWAIPRTSHWTGKALEDAGFEVRDCITHLFGSGFPKSLDISKAIDKAAGAEREPGALKFKGGTQLGTINDDSWKPKDVYESRAATPEAKQWQGWGTALKPAAEFWWLVRKPCSEKTVAANVIKHGTGGLNIDAGRIAGVVPQVTQGVNSAGSGFRVAKTSQPSQPSQPSQLGRFPANLVFSHSPNCTEEACDLFDCAVVALDEQSGALGSGGSKSNCKSLGVTGWKGTDNIRLKDTGGASRFFYCAKISSSERNAGLEHLPAVEAPLGDERPSGQSMSRLDGRDPRKAQNTHPTVKPKKLMAYLIRLITPPGGVVLDPFMGSGSTGLAAKEAGFRFIGVELDHDYFEIAKARIGGAK